MKQFFTFLLTVASLFQVQFLFAGTVAGTGGSTEITQILNNIELGGSLSAEGVTAGATLSNQIKDYSLDPVATKIANDLILRATNDTLSWAKTGFQGGGPAFIVNPDAYFKNVANQEIRTQLDSINKSNSQYKNALSVALVKNIRTGRTSVGAQLQFTLLDTVQKETCNTANLQQIAEKQADTNLSTSPDLEGLSRDERITKVKAQLYNTFCTQALKNDPQAQAKLQSCFDTGGCGGWGSLLAAYNPNNTYYGQEVLVSSGVKAKTDAAVETQKGKVSNGIVPKEVCKVRLTVDDSDNPYPDGEGPCVEWNVETPVEAVQTKINQAITGTYGKITNVHGFADLIGNVATNFLTNQVEKAFYSGLLNVVNSSSGNSGTLNVGYDNLLANNSKALPAELLPAIASIATPSSAQISTALASCQNPPEAKKGAMDPICKHLASIQKTNAIDVNYMSQISSYVETLNKLETCSQNLPGSSYQSTVDDRRMKINDYANLDDIKNRINLYTPSLQKLATLINSIVNGNDKAATDALVEYSSIASDADKMIPYAQEKTLNSGYQKMKKQTNDDTPKLNSDYASCRAALCTAHILPECAQINVNENGAGNTGNTNDNGL